ncbi:MAG TPA: endonuclease/exonuclease/phosphatase family protein [Jiangellales bacterium]|nr:endonuclease/exonuclease/phosphatase family protein [Jiangellales bacterium]
MARLRFGTFNILHGRSLAAGTVREDDLRAAAVGLDTDILALQEVDRGQPRSQKVDQASAVADALDAPWWRFAPAFNGTPNRPFTPADPMSDGPGPSFGIALVSRLAVLRWYGRRFPAAPVPVPLTIAGERGLRAVYDHPRVVLAAIVVGPDGPFTVVATHLSFVPGWNVRQLHSIIRWAAKMPGPRILLGDLNLPGRLPAVLSGWQQLARVPTFPSWQPRVQWDHVLADGFESGTIRNVTTLRFGISDHTALTVDVDW